jgi:hypothetical protein
MMKERYGGRAMTVAGEPDGLAERELRLVVVPEFMPE